MQYADNRALRETDVPGLRDARLRVRQARVGQHARSSRRSSSCAASLRACSASAVTPTSRSSRRWPRARGRCSTFSTSSRPRRSRTLSGTWANSRRLPRANSGSRDLAGMGHRLRVREAAAVALRVLRSGSEAVLSRRPRSCRGCSSSWRRSMVFQITPAEAPAVASRRALLSRSRTATARSSASSISTSTPAQQARRCMDGRCDHRAGARARHPDAGRLSQLQFLAAGRRSARAVHPRRSHHALPRVRPRPAPPAHAAWRTWAYRESTAWNGTRWSCRPSSWRTSAGSGTC